MKIFIKIRHILVAISALSFLFLFFSWNLCIPYACSIDASVCDGGNCIGESFGQHISERSILSNSTPQNQSLFAMIILLVFSIVSKNDIKIDYFSLLQRLRFSKNRYLCRLFNFFIIFFSKGLLHPKTF